MNAHGFFMSYIIKTTDDPQIHHFGMINSIDLQTQRLALVKIVHSPLSILARFIHLSFRTSSNRSGKTSTGQRRKYPK
jgi:hypothetical protein